MQTPVKYLHLKGMPTVLPDDMFPDELNNALMAKNEMEFLAAGMCVAGYLADCGRAPDLRDYHEKARYDTDFKNSKTEEQRLREMYVNMVDLMIMDLLKKTLDEEEQHKLLVNSNKGDLSSPAAMPMQTPAASDGDDDKAPEWVTFEHTWTEDEVNDFINDGKKRRLADGEDK